MKDIQWQNKLTSYQGLSELPHDRWRDLCDIAQTAMMDAYAPYSSYQVGAAVLLSDDTIVHGSNQENAVYPLGVCAERVTLLAACANHPDATPLVIAICTQREDISIGTPAFPCGSCRQTMVEIEQRYGSQMDILLLDNGPEIYHIRSVRDILPFSFGADRL